MCSPTTNPWMVRAGRDRTWPAAVWPPSTPRSSAPTSWLHEMISRCITLATELDYQSREQAYSIVSMSWWSERTAGLVGQRFDTDAVALGQAEHSCSQRAHPVVTSVVLDLGEAEHLEHGRHVRRRSARAGPSSGHTSRRRDSPASGPRTRPAPRPPASARRRCPAPSSRRAPSASRAGPRCSAGGSATRLPDPDHQRRRVSGLLPMGQILRFARRGGERPGVLRSARAGRRSSTDRGAHACPANRRKEPILLSSLTTGSSSQRSAMPAWKSQRLRRRKRVLPILRLGDVDEAEAVVELEGGIAQPRRLGRPELS